MLRNRAAKIDDTEGFEVQEVVHPYKAILETVVASKAASLKRK